MDKTFEKFLRSGISLAPVGAERREDNSPYFCTPKGASIFGWAGVDGIHYCFIRGFGGMVFAVCPMNTEPHYVQPLAKNFEDFLRLLLACGDVAALDQAWMMDETQFDAFLRDNPPTEEQKQVLEAVTQRFRITPMEQPWAYIRELQASFDHSRIQYTEDFYDPDMNPDAPQKPLKWEVCFEGSFWDHSGKGRAGTEIPLGKTFEWAGHTWAVPAVYSCGKGLVADICMQVSPDAIRRFREKWAAVPKEDPRRAASRLEQIQRDREDPLHIDFRPQLLLNGKTLRITRGSGTFYDPCLSEGESGSREAKLAMEHYGLDPAFGWSFQRFSFPWAGRKPSKIETLSLLLEQMAERIPGPSFQVHKAGDTVSLVHPVSGTVYTFTAQELESHTVSAPKAASGWRIPTHAVALSYTISPEPQEKIWIRDCQEGDRPVPAPMEQTQSPAAASVHGAAVIGVIGGADGPAVAFSVAAAAPKAEPGKENWKTAYSSLHFDPVQKDVEWYPEFEVTEFGPIEVRLL